ncbi:RNA polymerase sigma factor [Clostridium cylindrosporum]|uniref:RNA polymerase, sigma-24 subunit, ECF subfamily n=1 Tax=Clostridium cylindrosporum DSM 605 TaxID=1121307 RepID=A0A0J8DGR5_CLOCY|nr:RNA polymerase sigma factor [Clostridium cylindrosporum]KMT23388.1 RNA polymerase, sigma-24 subunit, ECF subfamily [Clostridium cylindrosporum DSM 605]
MNETKLIKLAQTGEKEAFEELIKFYYPYISKFLLKLSGDIQLSEDLTQDTFIKLIRSIEKFDLYGKAKFSTYVMTIARNTYIDYLRKNKHILVRLDDGFELISDINIEKNVLNNIEVEELMAIIDSLKPQQREAIKFKYLENLTLNEIAERLGCETKTIKSRIHNGMVKLRGLIKLKGGYYE